MGTGNISGLEAEELVRKNGLSLEDVVVLEVELERLDVTGMAVGVLKSVVGAKVLGSLPSCN